MGDQIVTGQQIKDIREYLGWTQEQLGEALGYRGANKRIIISAFERGDRVMSYQVAHLLRAIALGYRPDRRGPIPDKAGQDA